MSRSPCSPSADAFLPTTIEEVQARGWEEVDIAFVSGDAVQNSRFYFKAADSSNLSERVPSEDSCGEWKPVELPTDPNKFTD